MGQRPGLDGRTGSAAAAAQPVIARVTGPPKNSCNLGANHQQLHCKINPALLDTMHFQIHNNGLPSLRWQSTQEEEMLAALVLLAHGLRVDLGRMHSNISIVQSCRPDKSDR